MLIIVYFLLTIRLLIIEKVVVDLPYFLGYDHVTKNLNINNGVVGNYRKGIGLFNTTTTTRSGIQNVEFVNISIASTYTNGKVF